MNRKNLRLQLTLLCCIVLLCGAAGTTARAQHDKHEMPKQQPKQQPKPQPRSTPAPVKTQAPPHKHDAPGAETKETPTSAPDRSPKPASSPATAPEATSAPTHSDMPGMKHDSMPETKESGASTTSGIPTTDSLELMVMTDREMGIRVGQSASNTLNMSQMGSGTSWQPGTTPMSMYFKYARGWLLFTHWEAKVGVNSQGGPRGVTKFESQNWVMPMAFRRVGQGTLQLRGMFSLEPFTFAPGGSPQLFQTGETYKGEPLVDRQHPHDLFMELSATYTMPLGERATWFAYAGFPGEPALGPVAFMHRQSALENPAAPLAHHLQDSTHIVFGVFTTGFTYRHFKLEASIFNGREPDENRYNFDFNPWNSRSARLSFAPNNNWSMQVSHGFLRNPEALEPGDIRRTSASISYNKNFTRGNWATSLIWGRNHGQHDGETYNVNSYLIESTINFRDLNYLYTRLELVDKNELLRGEEHELLGTASHHPSFRIGAYTFGAAREIWNTDKLSVALGGDFTFHSKPPALDALYGEHPTAYKFFIRLRPSKMRMDGHGGMHQMSGQPQRP